MAQKFVDSVILEIRDAKEKCKEKFETIWNSHRTLYLGGGTPSLLSPDQIRAIVETLDAGPYEEFTMEVNPDDIVGGGMDYLIALGQAGVSRISMGVQSLNDNILRKMGRRHTAKEAVNAFQMLRAAGFDNISVDFIFGFDPDFRPQEVESWLRILAGDTGKLPEHVSCYQLSVEEGSGLEKMLDRGLVILPDEERCAEQYDGICSVLKGLDYDHYEISNWARSGYESRHNGAYWNHTPYLGFGPGAHSLIVSEGKYLRRWNNPDLQAYLAAAEDGNWTSVRGFETLSDNQLREEMIMLGLRTANGIPQDLLDAAAVQKETASGRLVAAGDRLRIPENKWFVSDAITSDLI